MPKLVAISARQYGLFTRRQAVECGFGRSAIDHRLATGTWASVDYGVYCLGGTSLSWHQRLLAACLSGPAVASHRSAARLWNVAGLEAPVVEVTARRHRRRHNVDVIWHETRQLDPDDHAEVEYIPTTTPVRTIIDLAAVVDEATLLRAYDDLARRNLVSPERVRRRLARFGGVRVGARPMQHVISLRDGSRAAPQSLLETRFELALQTAGLPIPVCQHEIFDHDGRFVARVDFAYPALWIAIEIDGARYHATQSDWQRDVVRQNRLVALGWIVLRFTADDLTKPREVADTVRRTLSRAQHPSGGVSHLR